MGQAYTPDDIPATEDKIVTAHEYEEAFKAFCVECGLEVKDGVWVDPQLEPAPTTLSDARGTG